MTPVPTVSIVQLLCATAVSIRDYPYTALILLPCFERSSAFSPSAEEKAKNKKRMQTTYSQVYIRFTYYISVQRVNLICKYYRSYFYGQHSCPGSPGHVCQCPVSGKSHFYPTLLRASIYAGCRACICRYFSEYSENSPKHGSKVGSG